MPELEDLVHMFPAEQFLKLYHEKFVFVLDGADELVDKIALYTLFNMTTWPNSVLVVTSRTGFYKDDREGLDYAAGPSSTWMAGIHLLPFNT